jgi:hypothetical protein
VFSIAYGCVFLVGTVGNLFVVLAVVFNQSMRNITNYLIMNLACADLLIMLFCLPTTLMNNVLCGVCVCARARIAQNGIWATLCAR